MGALDDESHGLSSAIEPGRGESMVIASSEVVVVAGKRSAFVLHPEAVAFNNDDLAVMNDSVEDGACDGIVIVKNDRPFFENPVGCEEC